MNQNINNKYKMYVFFNQHLDIKMIMLKRQYQLYIDKEICLILKNDLDEVQGYILCAKDLKVYEKNAYPYYLTLKELDEVKAERFPNANRELERFYPEYLAHIHIDILEEYTGNGVLKVNASFI